MYLNTCHSIFVMVPFCPPPVSKIKTSLFYSSSRFSIHPSTNHIFLALLFSNRAWNRVEVVYCFLFYSDSSSLDSLSCWSRLKIAFLRRSIFFPFTNDLWFMSSLKFDGIWSSHIGYWDLTFRLNKPTKLLSSYVRFFHVLLSTVIKPPLNLIVP